MLKKKPRDSTIIPARTRFADHRAETSIEELMQAITAARCRDAADLSDAELDRLATLADRTRAAAKYWYKLRKPGMTKRAKKEFKCVVRAMKELKAVGRER